MCSAAGGASEGLTDGLDGGQTPDRILYPVFEKPVDRTLDVARNLAAGIDGEAIVLVLAADDRSVSAEAEQVAGSVLQSKLDDSPNDTVRPIFEETNDPVGTLVDVAQTVEPGLVVFGERIPRSIGDTLRGPVTERVGSAVPCDVVRVSNLQHVKRISSILVPIAGGPHSELAARVAGAIGLGGDAVVELFHVADTPGDESSRIRALFDSTAEVIPPGVDVDTWYVESEVVESEDVAGEIVAQSAHYDLTVLGAPERSRLRRMVAGSVTDDVEEAAGNGVVVARRCGGPGFRV